MRFSGGSICQRRIKSTTPRSLSRATATSRALRPGRFFNASLDKASSGNERNAVWIRADSGIDVTCVQIAGYIARRILCYVRAGDRLRRGQRFGFIRFGSRVDVFRPVDARARVSVGDKVYGGESILAEIAAPASHS